MIKKFVIVNFQKLLINYDRKKELWSLYRNSMLSLETVITHSEPYHKSSKIQSVSASPTVLYAD